jgi:alpha-1,2-mannosyltransferase
VFIPLIGLVAVSFAIIWWFLAGGPRLDLDVYRLGAEMWLSGGDLYGPLPETVLGIHLPFTYPPIAAVLFVPFTWLSHAAASIALTLVTVTVLAVVMSVTLRSLEVPRTWFVTGLLLPVALMVEPVRETLAFGQVNVLLMGLVVLDCLVRRPRWPRGLLVGIAAAVKLTPAVFVLFFLLRGDRRSALTAGAAFAGTTAVGFVLNWPGSVRYWTETVFDTDRIGAVGARSNQSVKALLARLGTDGGWWVALAVLVLVLGVLAVRRALADGRPTLALGYVALAALPISPVSWSHHWVWAVPVVLSLGVLAWRTRAWAPTLLAGGGLLLFLAAPHWWWGSGDPWTAVRMLVGTAYLWFAVVALAFGAWSTHGQLGGARLDQGGPVRAGTTT